MTSLLSSPIAAARHGGRLDDAARHRAAAPARRRQRRLLAAVLPLALAGVALPAAAEAGSVGVDTTNRNLIVVDGGRNDQHAVRLSVAGDRVLVNDTVALDANLFSNDDCFNLRATEISCSLATVSKAEIHLGSRSDEILPLTSIPIRVEAGGGNDRLLGGLTAGVSQVDFRGGAGIDRADYVLATTGVTVTKDEAANDGRSGRDRDVIRGDVERIEGSAFSDSLNGSNATQITETFVGHGGDDVLSGNAGTNVYAMDAQADGADTVNGGSGFDRASYADRTRPVVATASIGDGNDGEAGERDSLRSVESVIGGRAGDTLSVPFGSRVGYQLAGGLGVDTLTGAEGPDELSGGPDRDTITAGGGDDRISARDQLNDFVSCGLGTDTAVVDAFDTTGSCETRQVG